MVRIELMCHFVEKVLNLNKVCGSGPKSSQKNCPVMPYACVKIQGQSRVQLTSRDITV